ACKLVANLCCAGLVTRRVTFEVSALHRFLLGQAFLAQFEFKRPFRVLLMVTRRAQRGAAFGVTGRALRAANSVALRDRDPDPDPAAHVPTCESATASTTKNGSLDVGTRHPSKRTLARAPSCVG
ncbi:MAG: hypothetical protein ABI488_01345, partial [Polyangiaceae bacterium]